MRNVESILEYAEAVEQCKAELPCGEKALFRGQGDEGFKLETTLERSGIKSIPFRKYYEWLDYHIPEINAIAHRFERQMTVDNPRLPFEFGSASLIDEWHHVPNPELLAYLRHHGFPSPLLDVTRSEYVALYFACRDENANTNGKVFVFDGNFDLGNAYADGKSCIDLLGPYFETDPRHLRQQSTYLASVRYSKEWFFEEFGRSLDAMEVKHMHEIVIQGGKKRELLDQLSRMNITAYTLFGDEDGLIKEVGRKFWNDMRKDGFVP